MGYRDDTLGFRAPRDEGLLVKIGKDLGMDTNLWVEKIRNAFSKEYPDFIAQSKPHFNFTHKDFANGVGVGGVTITVGTRILLFPIIIRDKELAPFDVFYDQLDRSWHYMTPDVEKGLLSDHNPYKGLSSDDLTSYDNIDSPQGNPQYASWRDPAKLAHLSLAKMEDVGRVLEGDFDRYANANDLFADTVKDAAQAYARQMADHAMQKEASSKKFVPGKYAEYDVALVRKEDIDTYSVKLGSYGRRRIVEEKLSSEGIRRLAADFGKTGTKILEDADKCDGATVTRGEEMATRVMDHNLKDVIRHKPGQVTTYGTYEVMLSSGRPAIGVAYPVMEWDGDLGGKMMFANHEIYALAGSFPGRRTSENMVLPDGNLSSGVKGFYVKNAEGQAFCTRPFRIEKVYSDEHAKLQIDAMDLSTMTPIHLVVTDVYKNLARINPDTAPELIVHEGENAYVPSNMRFVPLPENQVKILKTEDSAIKLAEMKKAEDHEGPILQITKKGGAYTFYAKEAELTGNAHEGMRDLERGDIHKMAFLAAICGAGIDTDDLEKMAAGEQAELFVAPTAMYRRRIQDAEKVASSLKVADYNFSGIDDVVESFDDVIAPKIPPVEDILKICMVASKVHTENVMPIVTAAWESEEALHKTAAQEEGGESINKIFNLNFLSKENVGYFIDHLETLNVAEDVLTRLLVIARIGNIGLDPGMVEATLEGLTEIKERFSQARVIMKNR
jgi:hypothetical protein